MLRPLDELTDDAHVSSMAEEGPQLEPRSAAAVLEEQPDIADGHEVRSAEAANGGAVTDPEDARWRLRTMTPRSKVTFLVAAHLAAATSVSGWTTLAISGFDQLAALVYGHSGAAVTLGAMLIVHVPFGLLLAAVLGSGRPCGVLRPPPLVTRRNCRLMSIATLALSAVLLWAAVRLILDNPIKSMGEVAQGSISSSSPAGGLSAARYTRCTGDGHALTISLVLTVDALSLLAMVWLSACAHRTTRFCSSMKKSSLVVDRLTSAVALVLASMLLAAASAPFYYDACIASPSSTVWQPQVVALLYDGTMAVHSFVFAHALSQSRRSEVRGEVLRTPHVLWWRRVTALLVVGFALAALLPATIRGDVLEAVAVLQLTACLTCLVALDSTYMGVHERSLPRQRPGSSTSPLAGRPSRDTRRSATGELSAAAASAALPAPTEWVRWRLRACGAFVGMVGAGAALCFVQVGTSQGSLHGSVPLQVAGALMLLHSPPLAALADVWFRGRAFAGFEPSDAPPERLRSGGARVLLLLAVALAAVGSGLVFAGSRPRPWAAGQTVDGSEETSWPLPPLAAAEPCYLIWGVEDRLYTDVANTDTPGQIAWDSKGVRVAASLLPGFDPTTPAAQLAFAAMCDELIKPNSPVHDAEKVDARPLCMMEVMRRRSSTWPLDSQAFDVRAPPAHIRIAWTEACCEATLARLASPLHVRHDECGAAHRASTATVTRRHRVPPSHTGGARIAK